MRRLRPKGDDPLEKRRRELAEEADAVQSRMADLQAQLEAARVTVPAELRAGPPVMRAEDHDHDEFQRSDHRPKSKAKPLRKLAAQRRRERNIALIWMMLLIVVLMLLAYAF